MPALGTGGVDIRSILATILNVIKSRANQVCAATCDGLVLRMHYRWTFFILLGGFLTVWYSWFHRDVITCVIHYNSDTQVRLDYVNVCLSYPYLEEEEGGRRYILFYRWISWSLLFLAALYYIPRKVSKNFDNARCKKLLEDLAANSHRYDQAEAELVERAARYVIFNLRTHDGLYWKFLGVNIVALLVDMFTMIFLNFILQGRFIQYGIKAYPFTRDPREFTDYMSQTFPPFASCELASANQLTNQRTEKLGCHLTIMELYEKLFLGLWLWLIILIFVTCCYIIFLIFMWLPFMRIYLLRVAKPAHRANDKVRGVIEAVSQNCKIGDIYLLYRIKGHLSHARYYELLTRISHPNLYNKQIQTEGPVPPQEKGTLPPNQPDIRNRKPSMPPQGAPVGRGYLQQNMATQDMMGRHPQNPEKNIPSVKQNTSILIG